MVKIFKKVKNALMQSAKGVFFVLQKPKYFILAIIFSFLLSLIIYFSINFNFYGPLLFSSMGLSATFFVLGTMIQTMAQSYFTDSIGIMLLIISLLQGMAISLLVYNIKLNRQFNTKVIAGSGFATIAAVIGLGCVPCGTSLLVPIMTIIFASSAPALLNTANLIVLILASFLSIYSLYKIGRVSYTNNLMKKTSKGEDNDEAKI